MSGWLFGRDASLYEVWQAGGAVLLGCAGIGAWRLGWLFWRWLFWRWFFRRFVDA